MDNPLKTKSKNLLYPVLTYKEFYRSLFVGNPLAKLADFKLEDVLITLILISNDVSGRLDGSIDVNKTILSKLPPDKAALLKLYINEREREGDKFILTNTVVIANLITDIFKLMPQETTLLAVEDSSFEEVLFDVILIYNEFQYPDSGIGKNINTHELLWRIMLMQDITGLNKIHFVRTSIIKYTVFIQFLKTVLKDRFTELEADFRKRTDVEGLYVLGLTLSTLFAGIENKFKQPGNPIVLIEKNESIYAFLKSFGLVFDQHSTTDREPDINFYVTHPFFEHSAGRLYLVDHGQFAFALDKGWIFYLYHNSKLKDMLIGVRSFPDFQGYLGKHYYENYLLVNLLKTLNRTGFRVLETDDKHLSDVTAILNEKDIFFFEIKSSSMHYNIVVDKNVAEFKKFLDDNFVKKKGAEQLYRNIKYFGEEGAEHMKVHQPKNKLTIYPIIIYTEQHLEKHAVNDYVRSQFTALTSSYEHPFQEIKPLIMIHYDFFIENISLLQNKPALLKKAINRYVTYFQKRSAIYLKTQDNMDYLKSMISFDKFIIGFEKLYQLDQGFIFKNISRIFGLTEKA